MRIEIIAIGDELLDGRTRDSNTYYLGGRLRAHGAILHRVTIVDDTRDALPAVFREAAARADLVITSGGLGPTLDDRTRDAIAETMGVPLEKNEDSHQRIKKRFESMQMDMPELNVRQAMMPKGAIIHPNPKGTADTFETIIDGTTFLSLPGVPHEFRYMVENVLLPRLSHLKPRPFWTFHAFGQGESELARRIEALQLSDDLKITWSARFPVITVELSVAAGQEELLADARTRVTEAVGPWMFLSDNRSVTGALFHALAERGLQIATAESCTGGLLASKITDIPGASQHFNRGYVTYSNDAKQTDLGVREETLAAHGAVSRETAIEMARGARLIAQADLALSITGIAGPDGGSEEKPVGLVHIACSTPEKIVALEVRAPRLARNEFKTLVCEIASLLALRVLEGRVQELESTRGVRDFYLSEES